MPATYFGYIGPWSTRPNPTTLDVGSEMTVTDVPVGGRSRWYSDGTNWVPDGGLLVLRSLGGGSVTSPVASVGGTGNKLMGLPGGAVSIPAGMIVPGRTILQVSAYLRKVGGLGTFAIDMRLGTTSSFSDSQILNLGVSADGQVLNAQVDVSFPSSSRFQTVSINAAANAASAGSVASSEETANVNTASVMYVNVGYNTGTSSDSLNLGRLLVRLFM